MADPLASLAATIVRVLIPPTMVVGVVGNSLNIAVLTRAKLYHHACSRYFLAQSIDNLLFSIVVLTFRLLAFGYSNDPSTICLYCCKSIQYVIGVIIVVSPQLVILASVDRFCASSFDAGKRKFSNVTVARWAITIVVIVFTIFYFSTFILMDLQIGATVTCSIRVTTLYSRVYPIMQALLVGVIPPILMSIFGFMTIYNTKQVRAFPDSTSSFRRTEGQLIRMLLLQVSSYFILCAPFATIYIMGFLPVQVFSLSTYYFIYKITALPYYLTYTTTFALYILSGSIYRNETVRFMRKLFRLRCKIEVRPIFDDHTNQISLHGTTRIMSRQIHTTAPGQIIECG
ncbi:unnamed protein product [Rotaria socialis]|uniref:G-protein coupled receptors family 1 profile domain-containing protein n=2 Tax=Rotaria TaxID=231623 RepID=A0A816DPS2_9BILA|nr:unnamed protein product [Rotaria magnacalcarata]CAF3343456.1 unnamed protein product [Rotaria socialis]CAF1640233.1 unnamed protein product [Rotaria magnacalcarata]CAF2032388.1 unnamed protein product [Rotaria magnacalcarata]CAF2110886.1 unnamed protein product [Rotaria magnacalcarata]